MERWAVRKRLRQVQRLLVDSRAALENASAAVRDKWLKDVLFLLSCRRIIMLNLLDRELGTFGLLKKPSAEASTHFGDFVQRLHERTDPDLASGFVNACEREESYLMEELSELMFQPGLSGHTRQMIVDLLNEAEENINDLRFVRGNVSSLRA